MPQEITLEDVLLWIHRNSDDIEAMSKVSLAAYPYSRKYKERYPDHDGDVSTGAD